MTPEELDVLKQLVDNHEKNAAAADVAYSNANPQPQRPDVAAPYSDQAGQYRTQANQIEKEAQTPYPQPQSFKDRVVAGIQSGMQDFGRLGAPGGSTGQEALKRKQFDDENIVRYNRVKDLRGQAQQQQELGQQTSYQRDTVDVAQRNATTNEVQEAREKEAGKRPKFETVSPGSVGQSIDANGMPVQGTRIENPKGPSPWVFRDIDNNGKMETWAIDPDTGRKDHYVADARKTAGPASGGMQIIQGTNGANGDPSYIRVRQDGPEGPVQVGGKTVGLKPAEAPAQLKNQADSAHITQKMIGVVRDLVKTQPNMTGPAVGRINELVLRYGADPGGFLSAITGAPIGTGPEATLSGHLAYLFLNEARATMPGRPAKEYMDFVKSRSAQMSQKPQILEGFLQSAENNARIIKDTARAVGYDLDAKDGNANNTNGGPTTAEEYLKMIGH